MNVSLDLLLRNARKNNRRDDGVAYLASKLDRRNPLKDKNINHNNSSAMHASSATLSRTDNKRSVPVEANRQVSHALRPIKQDSPRKNNNPKRVEAIMPNGNVTRRDDSIVALRSLDDHDPLKAKTTMNRSKHINNSQSPQFKAMAGLVHRPKNFDGLDRYDDALPSRLKRQVEDVEARDCRPKNKKKRGIESNEVDDGKGDDSFAKKTLESLPKDHVSLDCTNEATQPKKLTHRKLKKWRQDIMRNEDEELHVDGGDHSPLDADDDSSRLTSQAPILIDCLAKVPAPFVLEHVKKKCNYCSKSIDEPIWSGIFKIDGEEYISLAGHLSTKSCDKVWELSRSLMPVVEVTKLSRSKFKIWETSKPSCDSIGLYFFPNKLRHDEDLDKLVKEVIEDDLVLQTVIGGAEMLIFPSTLLPERYKTFQRKHYLWGVFRPRQDQCATVAEPVHDTVWCAQEKEKEEQHASNQQDEVQEVHWKSPAKSMQQAAATRAPEERQLGDALRHTLHRAEATAIATNPAAVTIEATAVATDPAAVTTEAATIPTEANENDTNAATIPGNHVQSDSIVGVPSGRFFCFVAGQTPKLEQLIQEMKREGSLVLAIRGETIGGGLWPGNIASTNISRA
ncbi:unnamed protein product [Miscanthus lutarioriparius]|uniref:AIPP2-like SPOC-like domain-containing protein n=1 Tax=Miscanthus lutarioriparius TaxID=422564 RepID=A0A811RAP0_9POAL|nr:unnamed protein product [Miscanthus lutarioriparius]